MNNFPHIEEAIANAPTVVKTRDDGAKYNFNIFPFGEQGHTLYPELISEIKNGMCKAIESMNAKFDYLTAPEPGGNTWALLVADQLSVPLNIVRRRPTGTPSEIEIPTKTGYNTGHFYLDGFKEGDTAHVVDDVFSTGSTLISLVKGYNELGVKLSGVQVILAKGEDYKAVEDKLGIPINALIYYNPT